jgi:hypothetical protein
MSEADQNTDLTVTEGDQSQAEQKAAKPRKQVGEAAVLVDFELYKVGQVLKGTPRAISNLADQGLVDNHPDAVAARRAEGAEEVDLEA